MYFSWFEQQDFALFIEHWLLPEFSGFELARGTLNKRLLIYYDAHTIKSVTSSLITVNMSRYAEVLLDRVLRILASRHWTSGPD
jgi:hypothetical protein